ncbi:MAG: Rne/Rng family ribonuclease, partial [Phycisphaerae bacterium]
MNKEMLINTVEGQECRIAVVSESGLEELYMERSATASHVGNIYKARITNVEPAIQAAFVDTGLGKNGFLHISDVDPSYFPKGKKSPEKVGRKRPHYVRPPIQECLRRGQEVVVQMTKEGIGTKGPTMTTYLSIPGRLLVMMPGMTRLGVSRKVEDEDARRKARLALSELKLPQEIGFIVRTAGIDRSKRDLQRDLNYLLRLWQAVKKRIKTARAPVELYRESDLVTRTIRDIYNTDIQRIICDNDAVARTVEEFLSVAVPRGKHVIELYTGKQGLFHDRGVEEEIEKIHSRHVPLPAGGSLVIDQTEALVAIDVNSGRFRQHTDAETTALKTNIQAAREIARQLRLRDMGGVIVIDFIDMREERKRRTVESTLRDAIKNDRAKTKLLRMSAFCIVELTRQRLGPSLKQSAFDHCSLCDGTGLVKSTESRSLQVMRDLQRACANEDVAHVEAVVGPDVAHYLNNYQRRQLSRLETETGKTIVIRADAEVGAADGLVRCTNSRGTAVTWEHAVPDKPQARPLSTVSIKDLPPLPPKVPAKAPPPAEPELP